ncbi:MAG: hypothetical protein J7L35_06475 [Anaerolineales bacterium]|nr:hypothetical protein [Anaerolineales bacterium]
MKKTILAVSLLVVTVLAFSVVSPAMASELLKGGPRNGDPEALGLRSNSYMGELGTGTGIPANQNFSINQEIAMDGLLDDIIHENLAIELGISPKVLAECIAAGESIYDISISLGFDAASFNALMADARVDALVQAVDLGLLTQEQADWVASRGFGNPVFENGDDCKEN